MTELVTKVHTVFGLAFDIEKNLTYLSGFAPAKADLGAQQALFGDLRLEGFAALLRLGFAERLIIIGGNEGRYKNESPPINRAWAIKELLVKEFDIKPDVVDFVPSLANTNGNIAAMVTKMQADELAPIQCGVVSNHYHLPRVNFDLRAANAPVRLFPAEAFILLEEPGRLKELAKRLGGGPLAERCALEIKGISDKLRGSYQPHTNTKA